MCVGGGGGGPPKADILICNNYMSSSFEINAVQVCGEKSMFKKERERERGGGGDHAIVYKLKEI